MPIAVICPRCKAKLKAPDNLVGKVVKCPGCTTSVLIPASAASPPASPSQVAVKPAVPPAPGPAARPTPPPASTPAPPQDAVVDRLEEVEEIDEVEEVLPAEGGDAEEVEEVDEVEDAEVVEEDDLEVVGEGGRKKKKRKKVRGVTESDRTTAMLLYLSALIPGVGFFGPLIIWLVKKGDSPYIAHHGKSALNFILGLGIPAILFAVTLSGLAMTGVFGGFGMMLLMLIVLILVSLYMIVMLFIFALKAKEGDWSEMPTWLQLFQ